MLRAADILLRRDVVDLTILGDPDERRGARRRPRPRPGAARLVDPATSPLRERFAEIYHELRKHKGVTEELALETAGDVTYFGTLMVREGAADGMVSGAAHTTGDTIRPGVRGHQGAPGRVSVVSSVFLMCLADRVLVYGDCAVNPKPDVGAARRHRDQLGRDRRDVRGRAADRDALLLDRRVRRRARTWTRCGPPPRSCASAEPDLQVEGPIQYDAASSPSVAAKKLPGSEVAGQATVFIFPDLETGNIAYKAVQRSAGRGGDRAGAAGPEASR